MAGQFKGARLPMPGSLFGRHWFYTGTPSKTLWFWSRLTSRLKCLWIGPLLVGTMMKGFGRACRGVIVRLDNPGDCPDTETHLTCDSLDHQTRRPQSDHFAAGEDALRPADRSPALRSVPARIRALLRPVRG